MEISQWVKNDATPRPLDSLVSIKFSPEVIKDGDHVADEDIEDVENQGPDMGQIQDHIATGRTRRNSHKIA